MLFQRSIKIASPAWAVWSALCSTDFHYQRGGHFKSRWCSNSNLEWVADNGAENFTGKILQINKTRYLSFLKFGGPDKKSVVGLITFQLRLMDKITLVCFSADLFLDSGSQEPDQLISWIGGQLDNLPLIANQIHVDAVDSRFLA